MHSTAATLLDLWTEPQQRECLPCYVNRMLADFGCDGTVRWARRWRDLRAAEVASLDRTLQRARCDCEVPGALGAPGVPTPGECRGGSPPDPDGEPPPPCPGVRRGSTKPCSAQERPPPDRT